MCVFGWRRGSVFVETSTKWNGRWSKKVDKKFTRSTERGPMDIDLPQVLTAVTCLLLWPAVPQRGWAAEVETFNDCLCLFWDSWGSHEKSLKWNMRRCRSICQPAIKFSHYVALNCHFKVMDNPFLLLQPSLWFSKALDPFSPESADDFSQWCKMFGWGNSKIMKFPPAPGLEHWETPFQVVVVHSRPRWNP